MKSRPNILVFLTDDHGQWASSCYGNSEIQSPSMEYLARSGAKMTNAFTPCPVCSPARACFFTGKIPSAHGIHDHVAEGGEGRAHPGFKGQTTIAEHLHRAGYHTGLVGKWHLNHFRGKPPGFDQWFTLATGTNAQFRKQPFYEDHREVVRHGNQAHCLTDRALQLTKDGRAAWTVGLRMRRTKDGNLYIEDIERLRGTPSEVDAAILRCARADGTRCTQDLPQDPGAAGKHVKAALAQLLGADARGLALPRRPHSG